MREENTEDAGEKILHFSRIGLGFYVTRIHRGICVLGGRRRMPYSILK